MKRKIIIPAISLILLLAAGILYSLPYVRIYQIVSALQTQDRERLARYIDFPALRLSIKTSLLQAGLGQNSGSGEGDRLRRSLAEQVLIRTIDQWLSPSGLTVLFRQHAPGLHRTPSPSSGDKSFDKEVGALALFLTILQQTRCSYESADDFRIVWQDPDRRTATITLTRTGFEWRWSRLDLPWPGNADDRRKK